MIVGRGEYKGIERIGEKCFRKVQSNKWSFLAKGMDAGARRKQILLVRSQGGLPAGSSI